MEATHRTRLAGQRVEVQNLGVRIHLHVVIGACEGLNKICISCIGLKVGDHVTAIPARRDVHKPTKEMTLNRDHFE